MTFDNVDELEKVSAHYPDAELVLRILADDSHSVCRLGLKFGAPLDSVRPLLVRARELKLNVIGVSYHVGSGNTSADAFGVAIADARTAFNTAASLGFTFKLLDVGGGFPGSTHGVDLDAEDAALLAPPTPGTAGRADPYAGSPSFRTIARSMRAALATHFPPGCGVDIIGEPGRFFVKSSHALAVSIVGKRATRDGDAVRLNYFVNDGLYGSFNCLVYDHASATPARLVSPARGVDVDLAALARAAANADAPDAIAVVRGDGSVEASDALGLAPARALARAAAESRAADDDEEADGLRARMVMGGGDGAPLSHDESVGFTAAGAASFSSPSSSSVASARTWSSAGGVFAAGASGGKTAGSANATASARLPKMFPTTLWGPTCDSFDKIDDAAVLPEMHPGDWLFFENMGAYTIAGSCKCVGVAGARAFLSRRSFTDPLPPPRRFNGFPLSSKVYIHPGGRVEVQVNEEA